MPDPRILEIQQLEDRRLLALNPTGAEQELLQLVNRFRTSPAAEFSRMFSSVSPLKARDADVQIAVDYFGTNGTVLKGEFDALSPSPPLAWNEAISDYAKGHNTAMTKASPPHAFHSNTTARRQALLDAGVNLRIVAGEKIHSENVFGAGTSPQQILASYLVEWGPGANGMLSHRRHREALLNPDYEQMGQALTTFTGGSLGPIVNTQVIANIEDPPTMAVGALFEDKNGTGWYESGEGIGGASIKFVGPGGTYTTQSLSAGGYQIELPAGTYQVTASGGGMKHSVVSSVTIGSSNAWLNLEYDPNSPPPDRLEPNNSTSAASVLTGETQTVSGLSIHSGSDRDFFKFTSRGTGTSDVALQFSHSTGDLTLRLLNSSGAAIATAASSTNNESLSAELTRGSVYYVEVTSVGSQVNGNYTLTVDPPKPAAPVAVSDSAHANNASRSATIDVLANDSDPDGPSSSLTFALQSNAPSAFTVEGNKVTYSAPVGFSGFHTAGYRVTDDQGLVSGIASIRVFVVNFDADSPWQNSQNVLDVNGDGVLAPNDVLLVVNELNARNSRRLPTGPSGAGVLSGFVDTDGDGFVSPIDVLGVVNRLNSASGEGESATDAISDNAHDIALAQLALFDELERRRKSS